MAEIQYVDSADGTRIAYRVAGDGEPVVFVHGAATSSADWLFALPFLRERMKVVSMDRRGRGASGDSAGDYAMEREAEDVLAVLEAVGASLLVGHSYGALCSILVAAEHADRLRRLVLYEPPIAVTQDRLAGLAERVDRGALDEVLAGFLRGAGVLEEQLELIRSSPAWSVLLDGVPSLPRELQAAARWRHPQGPIDLPALFLLGADTRDSVYLDGLDDLRAAFPGSRCEKIAGQTHIAHVLAAEEFARLVGDFLLADAA